MSDTQSGGDQPDKQSDGQGGQPGQGGMFRVASQYVKDLSFENPGSPASLAAGLPQPSIDLLIDVIPRQVAQDQYEVALKINAKAARGEDVVFIVELLYAGLFNITGVAQEHLQPLLLIECPRFLFPFARRVISDATRDGGFPALALDYMDFERIYRQQLAKHQEKQKAAAEAGDAPSVDAPAEGEA